MFNVTLLFTKSLRPEKRMTVSSGQFQYYIQYIQCTEKERKKEKKMFFHTTGYNMPMFLKHSAQAMYNL